MENRRRQLRNARLRASPAGRRPPRPVSQRLLILFLVAHAPLAMAMKASAIVATGHALLTFAVGFAAVARSRSPERVLYVMGYIIASEPQWRAFKSMIFWESGKFAIAGLSLLALFKWKLIRRADKVALLYFLALLPSILVLPGFDREAISFNLSGPFALSMCTLFMSTLKIPPRVFAMLFLITLAPILGLTSVATFSTVVTEGTVIYGTKIASAGLGQNQASSTFGLGGLLAFLYLCIGPKDRLMRWIVGAAGVWCMAQGVLTFSRGGIVTTAGAIFVASFFLLQDRRSRSALILRMAMILALAAYVVVPIVDSFTGGAVRARFTSTELTGRDKIVEADLIVFRDNPLFGVGPGQSKYYHSITFRFSAAHTEYSRLLAEHGSFGLFALFLLGWMSLLRVTRRSPLMTKALASAFTTWSLLFMLHAAMRMAAASFFFALGASYLLMESRAPQKTRKKFMPPSAKHRPLRRPALAGAPISALRGPSGLPR